MLEPLITHQIPFNPIKPDKMIAPGMRMTLKIMPTKDGTIDLPIPLKAPAVVDSMHIKSCEKPMIIK